MPPLLYPLPTTSLLTFSNILHDPSNSYTTALADATSSRTKLYLALKASANHEPGASALSVVDAVQGYLPYLRGITACLESDELLLKGEPAFQWPSPLTHYTVTTPLLPLPSIHSEHLFVLLTYTLALSNFAHFILASLPTFESSHSITSRPHMTSEDEKRIAAGLTRAVDLLCQAAGVAEWTAENMVPVVEPVRIATGGRVGKNRWPVEVGSETFRGLAMTLLADAHVTAIRKLLLPVLTHTLFAPPGPPLPSNHPSPSLLAKLYLHVSSLYTSARALMKVHSDHPSSSKKLFRSEKDNEPDSVEGEIIPLFKRYLRKESNLASALSYKWLGVDVGENGKGAKVGEAIAWVKEALGRLEDMEDGVLRDKMKGLGMGRGNERKKEERRVRKGKVERELEDVGAWLRVYTRMNETVAFQPIPSASALTIPSGRPIFTAKPFKPPASKLGPSTSNPSDANGESDPPHDESYAGKGNYY